MIKLVWDDGPERPADIDEIVRADLLRVVTARCLIEPWRLVTHHVQLTDDHEGPSVHVYGMKGSDAFHCKYLVRTQWLEIQPPGNDP